jgi:hypothetical protein
MSFEARHKKRCKRCGNTIFPGEMMDLCMIESDSCWYELIQIDAYDQSVYGKCVYESEEPAPPG